MSQGILRVGFGLGMIALLCSGAFAQNLVENWSFEEPVVVEDIWPGYFHDKEDWAATGWTVTPADRGHGFNNNGDVSPFLGGGRPIPDGDQVMFVQGAGDSTVSQVIDGLEEGEPYMLIFYTGIRPGNAGMDLTVTLGGVEMMGQTRFASTGTAPLERITLPFVYTSGEFGDDPELAFHSVFADGGDVTILYDAVEVRKPVLGAEVTGPGMVAQGDTVVLSANLTESVGNTTYQWFYDGVELDGETGATLELLDVVINDSGAYSVEVTDDAGTATAAYTLVVVEALPVSSTLVLSLIMVLLLGAGVWTLRSRTI